MKKAVGVVLIVICMLAALLSGCKTLESGFSSRDTKKNGSEGPAIENTDNKKVPEPDEGKGKKIAITLYFANRDNSAIPSENRELLVKDGAIMRTALEALIEGPENKDLVKAIPEGTRILGLKRTGNTAIVDFSKEYSSLNGVAEIVARATVVNTLTGINGIEKVRILVEGKDLIGPSGEPFGEMQRFLIDSKGYPLPGEKKTVTLYFSNTDASAVVGERREITVSKGESIEKIVFEELVKGPGTKGLNRVIPDGAKLLSIGIKDGLCTINLTEQFIDNNKTGSAGESMTIFSIVNSLTELPGVEKVQFLINGKKQGVYIHMIFDEPFVRNTDIIQK